MPVTPDAPFWVIRLDARVAVCHICGAESPPRWGIQIYAGAVVPNNWPGEWGGVDACHACWARQGQLVAPMAIWAFRQASTQSGEETYESR